MKNNVFGKVLQHPLTPVLCLISGWIVNECLVMRAMVDWAYLIELLCGAVGIAAAVSCYPKGWLKRIALGLLIIMVLDSGIGLLRMTRPQDENTSVSTVENQSGLKSSTSNYRYTYPDYSNDRDSSSGSMPFGSSARSCTFCSGSGKCHLCYGKGYSYCNGPACSSGRCNACRGTGVYDHGSYVSRCIVCSGDGLCDICGGTTRVKCHWCNGSGRCAHCNGSGKKS